MGLVFSIEKLDVEMPGPFEYRDKIPSAFSSCRLCGYLPPLRRGRQQGVQRAAQQAVEAEAGKNRGTTHPCIQLRGEGGLPIANCPRCSGPHCELYSADLYSTRTEGILRR